jgi:hypothetical protein
MDDGDVASSVGRALADLVNSGEVLLYQGRWDADPEQVTRDEALRLLEEPLGSASTSTTR